MNDIQLIDYMHAQMTEPIVRPTGAFASVDALRAIIRAAEDAAWNAAVKRAALVLDIEHADAGETIDDVLTRIAATIRALTRPARSNADDN